MKYFTLNLPIAVVGTNCLLKPSLFRLSPSKKCIHLFKNELNKSKKLI